MNRVPPSTVADLFEHSRATIRCSDGQKGVELSAGEVFERGLRRAASFRAAGANPGDRIAVQMTNTALYLEMLAACAVGGFVLMSVNTRFSPDLATSLIERSGARWLVRSVQDLPAASEVTLEHVASSDDRFVIFTTSGTTSAPKLVVHRQRSVALHASDVARQFRYTDDSTLLIALPLCGTFGLTVLMGGLAGDSRILLCDFDALTVANLVEHHQVTSMHATDDMFHRMLGCGHDLSSLECAGYARFNTSLDRIVDDAENAGVDLLGLYGMSEVQALFAMRDPALPKAQRWKPGGELTSEAADYRVVDSELQLKGPSLFEGYLADGGDVIDQQLTAGNFDDGWFRTGDLAVAEDDRGFRYETRIGDSMRLGGFLVAPAEIETTLQELDAIDQAQVVAVDLPQGARPVAFVIAQPGMTVDEAAAIDHCRVRLATFKAPIHVVTVDEFPVTDGPNGIKIQRTKLRDQAIALIASQRS